ncbi:hemicentin-2 isoform X1 [Nothobranchius furzeri]|uniref:hemicentin-2 isoform X1 n=1 Tax=Nothobranchius furzeri TaxID=105023 RepID=UPI0039046D58
MSILSLLVFCLMRSSGAAAGLYSTDPSLVVSTEGQSICLPCGVPSESCSSINWKMEERVPGWFSDVVMDGRVTSADARYHLLKDCSLEIAQVKPDDAHMYTCQSGSLKSSVSLRILEGGLEEVFAAVGESVSLTCTSSLSSGGNTEWTVNKTPLRNMSSETSPTKAFHLDEDSSLVISKLSPLNAGEYQCTESTGLQRVLNKIRLHTLDVTAESTSAGVKLTCVLTCAEQCEENFNLSWSGTSREGWQSRSTTVNKTLISMMLLTVWPQSSDEFICSVKREGSTMALKEWHADFSLQTLIRLCVHLVLLMGAAAGGLYTHMKWKQRKAAATEHNNIEMYEEQDLR